MDSTCHVAWQRLAPVLRHTRGRRFLISARLVLQSALGVFIVFVCCSMLIHVRSMHMDCHRKPRHFPFLEQEPVVYFVNLAITTPCISVWIKNSRELGKWCGEEELYW